MSKTENARDKGVVQSLERTNHAMQRKTWVMIKMYKIKIKKVQCEPKNREEDNLKSRETANL